MSNLKRLTLASIILTAFTVLIACGGAEERKAAYMEKATKSYEAGDYEKAKVDIRNVLQIDPKHSEATYMLGAIAESNKEYRKALGLYNKAIELDSTNVKARYSLGKFYIQLKDTKKVQNEIDSIEASSPDSFYAKSLRAALAFSEKKYSDAIDIVNGIQTENRNEDVYVLLAASHYGVGSEDKLLEALIEGIQRHNKSVQLRAVLAKVYIEKDDKESAIKTLKENIDIEPDNMTHYYALSAYYQKLGDMESAKNIFLDLVNKDPDNEDYQLLMVQYIATTSGDTEAIDYLKNLIAQYPDVDAYVILHAKFELKAGNNEKSSDILENVISRQLTEKGVNDAKNILAAIKASSGDMEGAHKLLNEVLETSPADMKANFARGKILLKENKPGEAVGPLRVVVRENPNNSAAYVLLANAHQQLNEKDLAYDVISHGFRENPGNQFIANVYVKLLLDKGEHEYAMKIMDSIADNDTTSMEAKYLRAKVYLANNEFIKTEAIAKELIEAIPDKDVGYAILAQSYIKNDQVEKARDTLKDGLDASKSPKLLVEYTRIQTQLGETDNVINFLKSYSEHKAIASSLIAELYALKKDYVMAESYYKKAIEFQPKWDAPYYSLATLQSKRGDTSSAIDTYKTALNNIEDNRKIKFMMAATYELRGDINEAIDLYRSLMVTDPDNIIAVNNLATLLVDNYQDEASLNESLKLVDKIKENKNEVIKDTVAWVYVKNGKYDEAIRIFNEVVEKRPDVGIFKYHLGMAYYYKGDALLAKQYLEEAVAIQSNAPWKNEANTLIRKLDQG